MYRIAAVAVLLVGLFIAVLHAQSTNASLSGRLTDSSNALIVAAKVTAFNAATSIGYKTRTDASGNYYFTDLPPGTYRLELEKAGFKKIVKAGVRLHVQDSLLLNFEMPVGA